jgi:hypothetical protein
MIITLTTTAMYIRTRVAVGKNTTTAVGTACRTIGRRSRLTLSNRRDSGAISAPLLPPGVPEIGVAVSVEPTAVLPALEALVAEASVGSVVVVGTVGISVASVVLEEVGVAAALAGLVAVLADFAAGAKQKLENEDFQIANLTMYS